MRPENEKNASLAVGGGNVIVVRSGNDRTYQNSQIERELRRSVKRDQNCEKQKNRTNGEGKKELLIDTRLFLGKRQHNT